jgi:hypothetical protein
MAFAEGTTIMGRTFREVFEEAAQKTKIWEVLNNDPIWTNFTFVFELTSPETRIVTPYEDVSITLIGIRSKSGNEMYKMNLDEFALMANVKRPISYKFNTIEETIEAANALNVMDEGFVLVYERDGSFWRIKCKNSKYLAIAHMRNNGSLSPKRVLFLVMKNEQEEYLRYFECDKKYFDFVEGIYAEVIGRILAIYESSKDIVSQKDYAITIIPQCKYDFEQGILFTLRKGKKLGEILNKMDENDARKISKSLNLRKLMSEKFSIQIDEENV